MIEWLAERGVTVDPSTVYDWVGRFRLQCIAAVRVHRTAVGNGWRVDETYLTIGGRWRYLYRAIDEHGQIVDVYLSERRNAEAAHSVFTPAIADRQGTPTQVTTETAKSYPKALQAVLPAAQHRSSKDLTNRRERDHQHLKGCVRSRRRFKQLERAGYSCRGAALIWNRHHGFSRLIAGVAARRRIAVAWAARAATLSFWLRTHAFPVYAWAEPANHTTTQ